MQDVDTLKGLHGVKTLGSSKKRSIPKVQSSTYLELYMMEKEGERLVKESKRLEIRHIQVKKRLKEIAECREIAHRNTVKKSPVPVAEEEASPKTWKKVSMNY